MTAKDLRDQLKALRAEHTGGALTKMSVEQVQKEIAHHETACKARELKEKRMAALEAAREAKKAPAPQENVKRAPKAVPKYEDLTRLSKKLGFQYPKKAVEKSVSITEPVVKKREVKQGAQTIADRAEEKKNANLV